MPVRSITTSTLALCVSQMRRAKLRTQHYHDTVSRTNFLSISILTRAASLFDLFATLHMQPNDPAVMSIGDLIPCQMTNTIPSGSHYGTTGVLPYLE